MSETLRVERRELSSTEILEQLRQGNRVIIETSMLGKTMRMSIREREGTYYCDTPIKLLKYDSETDLQTCLERYRLAEESADAGAESTRSASE